MTNQEIREYAEAVIVALERKKAIKAKMMNISCFNQVLSIVGEYLNVKKQGVNLDIYLSNAKIKKNEVIKS